MAGPAVCYHPPVRSAAVLLLVLLSAAPALAASPAEALVLARKLYNEGEYDKALEAVREAESTAATAASAHLVVGRILLERYRRTAQSSDLDRARVSLRGLDTRALDARERVELQVGLAEVLFFDDRFGAAAEVLDPILESSVTLGPEAHDRALDWWASSLDRYAQTQPASERGPVYTRLIERMEEELRREAGSTPASYWLVAAARGSGDLERAWAAAAAAWVRAILARDRGATLRADLDRLVTQALIPDRATRIAPRDRRQAIASMTSEWEEFKSTWMRSE
jgi:hypothetical protein